jgi:hypothetical protein
MSNTADSNICSAPRRVGTQEVWIAARARFLMLKDVSARDPNATPANMVVVEHWFEELKSRVR